MNTRNTIRLNHSNRSRIVIVPTLECGSSAAAFATFSLPPKPTVNHNLNPAKGHLFLYFFYLIYLLNFLYFFSSGAGYSGNFSLLVSALFTSNSSNSSEGAMIVCGTPPARLLTSGSFPSATRSFRSARTSSSLNTAPRPSSSCPSEAYTRYSSRGAFPGPSLSTRCPHCLPSSPPAPPECSPPPPLP